MLLLLASASGNPAMARDAATQMLAAYNVGSEEELRLASEVISFGFHALQALGQAVDPTLSLNKITGLRGSAVSLRRKSRPSFRSLPLRPLEPTLP